MEHKQTPKDDIDDVIELTNKLMRGIRKTLDDHDTDIALSALISACVNSITEKCETVGELLFYKDILNALLINVIKNSKPQF